MAGLVVCDMCSNLESNLPLVKAVVSVSARAIDRSTVLIIEQIDVCDKHIVEAVESLWQTHRVVPNLHDIIIVKV